jgi:hypothetical protein
MTNARKRRSCLALVLLLGFALPASAAQYSELWGKKGEKWSPQGRLPDFSYAGYRCGQGEPPRLPTTASVKQFGAIGDGVTDDSGAFLAALATVHDGAIEVPPGRYRITKILVIDRPNVTLRGAGSSRSTLYFPRTLHEIKPDWSATTSGKRTSNYSWSGGFLSIQGAIAQPTLATVTGEARRGDRSLRVSATSRIRPGQRIEIFQTDDAQNSLASDLYSNEPGDTSKLQGRIRSSLVCRVTAVERGQIRFDRPLRCDVRPQWKPLVRAFEPSVSDVVVEGLCFEFPKTDYQGHFSERGYNAIAIRGAADCWIHDLRIVNADSGIYPGGYFCTISAVVFESQRKPDKTGCTGHHGIYFTRGDNLFTGFDFRTRFIHDITVSHCAGNVCCCGKGLDLCFDHHKCAPYENLFSDIDIGAGNRLWECGGGQGLGKNCGARGTFWNIRARKPQPYPPTTFGPSSINIVGLETDQPPRQEPQGRWFEVIPFAQLCPPDLYQAQHVRRLTDHD